MKRILILAFFAMVSLPSSAQINFEQGYIVNEAGTTTPVYIRFNEMAFQPTEVVYKLTPEGEVQRAGVSSIKEFGVGDNYKYTRHKVQVDQSPQDLRSLTRDRNPVFTEEILFLKTEFEGEYSLLSSSGKFPGYFVRTPDGQVEQLIFKKYNTGGNIVRRNNRYKQQLMTLLKCEDISENDLATLNYTKNDFIRTFKRYHECAGKEYKVYRVERKGELNIMAKAGVNFTNFGMEQDVYDIVDDFNYEIDPRIGLEIEYILPLVNRKLAVYMEPSFSMYNAEQEIMIATEVGIPSNPEGLGGYRALVNMDYKILDLPLGLRYYMYLDKANTLKMFVNAGASINLVFNSSTILNKPDDEIVDFDFNQSWQPTFFGGVGYRYSEKWSVEVRYFPVRPLTDNGGYKLHQNHSFALVAGYTLF